MEDKFEVFECTPEALEDILANKSDIPPNKLTKKLHIQYFEDYFKEIRANTIVVENYYVDHDYTEDHAEYYVKCFKKYERKCTRLHIFKNQFTLDDFNHLLTGEKTTLTAKILQDEYLGFIVIKPLPQTIIGRTCLKTYPCNNTRYFPITRSYSVNLFGVPLSVKNTLAFQEQDTVVAACATSALWSIFQGTGKLFQHAIPSPSAITKVATEYITDKNQTRAFPSKGLDVIAMARAIKSVELEPYTIYVTNEYVLRSSVYAYLRMGIPIIFGFPLYDTTNIPNKDMGKHAVALTGYSLPDVNPIPYGSLNFRLKANKINKFYVHDDQVGPFARMIFDDKLITVPDSNNNNIELPSLSTSWANLDGTAGARAWPELLLFPLYHKIRIPFGSIHDQIMQLDALIGIVFNVTNNIFNQPDIHEWDIYLTTVNNIKTEILDDINLDKNVRQQVLTSGMPKYIWRSTLQYNDLKILDIFFDATDIEQSSFVINVICYNTDFLRNLIVLANHSKIKIMFENSIAWPIIEWINKNF